MHLASSSTAKSTYPSTGLSALADNPVLFLTYIIDLLKRPFVNLTEALALMGLKFDSGHKMLVDENKVRLVQPLSIRIQYPTRLRFQAPWTPSSIPLHRSSELITLLYMACPPSIFKTLAV